MKQKLNTADRLRLTAAFLVVLVGLSAILAFYENQLYEQRWEKNLYLAENQVRLMEGTIETVMARVYTLRALVKDNEGNTDFFDELADELYQETVENTGMDVKNMLLAPDGVVAKVYPSEGNGGLLGLDYMDSSQEGNEEAIEAYKENRLVLTNPFSLRQGGRGVAGRLPVYLDDDDPDSFWGMVSVTLDFDRMLEQFNLDYLEKSGINYRLWYTDSDGNEVVLDASDNLPENPASCDMQAGNLTWTLDVAPVKGWFPLSEIFIGVVFVLAISLMTLWILYSRARVRAMNVILEELAVRDNLTGCYSRHFVSSILLMPGTQKWQDPTARYSLAVVDVDRFKDVNDTWGHEAGDQVLVAVARMLQGLCTDIRGDCVIRYGGDEFIFLMNHVNRKLFEGRLKDMVSKAREIRIPEAPGLRVSVSVGATMGTDSQTYYEMFSDADKQVYLSKESGRDQYHLL